MSRTLRLSLAFCLLLSLAPVASADLIVPERQAPAPTEDGERWLPTALVGSPAGSS